MPQASVEHLHIPARNVRPFPKEKVNYDAAKTLGVQFRYGMRTVADMASSYFAMDGSVGMDSVQTLTAPANIPNPVQFLQNWLPGQVHSITAIRQIDQLIGVSTIGNWEDEQIVQTFVEPTGYGVPYSDYGNVPLASWNNEYIYRTVVRFELGMKVGVLEEARTGRVNIASANMKRQSCGLQLEIARNLVGFNGYNSGNDNTYGFLNDPNLPGYVTVANGAAGSPLWTSKTFLEICADIRTSIATLRKNTQGVVDPAKTPLTLALPTNAYDYLSVVSDFGKSVLEWLRDTYPRIRVEQAPQLNTANGGVGAYYLYADEVQDASTDDGRVWIQVVPARFMVVGVAKEAKGFLEAYSMATAGSFCKRPFAVVRYSGIS